MNAPINRHCGTSIATTIQARLGIFSLGLKLLRVAVSWRLPMLPKSLEPIGSDFLKAWKPPPWMEAHWNAGVPISGEELAILRRLWLEAHPDRRAEFEP